MAKGAREVPVQNVRVEIRVLAAVNGVDEVLVVAGRALETFNFLALFVEYFGGGVTRDNDTPTFAIDDEPNRSTMVLVHFLVGRARGQAAHFEDERRILVFVKNDQRVRRGAIVDVTDAAADAEDARRKGVFAEDPAGDVHLVNPLVAQIAVAGRPNPMPIIMQILAHQRILGGGTTPQIVVDVLGHGLGAVDFADARAPFVAQATRSQDFANVPFAQPLNGFVDSRPARAGLRAGLNDAVVFAGGFDELASFPDIVGNRFLDVDVFTGLHGPDRRQGLPMVRRRNRNDVDVFVLEQLPNVGIALDGEVVLLALVDLAIENFGIDVAESDQSRALHFRHTRKVIFAAAIEANHSVADVSIGAGDGCFRGGRRCPLLLFALGGPGRENAQRSAGSDRGAEKTAAI